jgi:hypothetical protein
MEFSVLSFLCIHNYYQKKKKRKKSLFNKHLTPVHDLKKKKLTGNREISQLSEEQKTNHLISYLMMCLDAKKKKKEKKKEISYYAIKTQENHTLLNEKS